MKCVITGEETNGKCGGVPVVEEAYRDERFYQWCVKNNRSDLIGNVNLIKEKLEKKRKGKWSWETEKESNKRKKS